MLLERQLTSIKGLIIPLHGKILCFVIISASNKRVLFSMGEVRGEWGGGQGAQRYDIFMRQQLLLEYVNAHHYMLHANNKYRPSGVSMMSD